MKNPNALRKEALKQGDMKTFRKTFGLSQAAFWTPLGVTQSAGSRYESTDRSRPKPLVTLISLMYGDKPLTTLANLRSESVEDLKNCK